MTSPGPSLPLAILQGRSDEMRAEIVVDVAGCDAGDGGRLNLTGTLVGPRRGRDMTLPVTVGLVDVPTADVAGHAIARAVFTEPAYWTPELPNLYALEARVCRGDRTLAVVDRMIGLRRLGVRGRSLWLEGRRWVPRGVTISPTAFDPTSLRSLSAAAVIDDPSEALCEAADQAGVAVVARLTESDRRPFDPDSAVERIAAWAVHPSVVLAVVPRMASADGAAAIIAAARPLKGTMLLGVEVDGTQPPSSLPAAVIDAVECIVVHLPDGVLPHEGWRSGSPEGACKPLLAQRAVAGGSAAEHRQACDRLQASLAAWGLAAGAERLAWDWAGYLSTAW